MLVRYVWFLHVFKHELCILYYMIICWCLYELYVSCMTCFGNCCMNSFLNQYSIYDHYKIRICLDVIFVHIYLYAYIYIRTTCSFVFSGTLSTTKAATNQRVPHQSLRYSCRGTSRRPVWSPHFKSLQSHQRRHWDETRDVYPWLVNLPIPLVRAYDQGLWSIGFL